MNALLIILTGVLILVNAFFVIAEYSLVRSRRARLQAMADEGQRGARRALSQLEEIGDYIAACQVGITMASIGIGALGEPAIADLLQPVFGGAVGHTAAVAISVVIAYLLITIAQSIVGEIAPKLYTIQHAEDLARRVSRPLGFSRLLFTPFIVVLNSASNALLRAVGTDPDAEPEGGTPGRDQADHRRVTLRRQPRCRRGEHAHRGVSPARAGGPPGDDADSGGGDRRSVGDRPGCAAPLRVDRPLAPGRDRGREPGPGQGDRPRQPAGQADDGRWLRGTLRQAGARGADRPRDQAARRPARRPAARADRAGDRDRRVRAHGGHRHHRGHHRGGRRRDR